MFYQCSYDNFPLNYEDHPIGVVRPYVREVLTALREWGWRIVIWTTRTEEDKVAQFLDEMRIPYDTINKNVPEVDQLLWYSKFRSPRKVFYTHLIDDRAGFDGDWLRLLKSRDWKFNDHTQVVPPPTEPCSCKFHEAIAYDPLIYSR